MILILKFFIAVTNDLALLALLIGCLFAYGKANKWLKVSSVSAGLLIGLTVFLIKSNAPKKTNLAIIKFHRITVIVMCVLALLTCVCMVLKRKKKAYEGIATVFFSLLIVAGLAFSMPTVFQYTTEFVYFGEDSISSMMLLRVIGFLFGLGLCYVVGMCAYCLLGFVSEKRRDGFVVTLVGISFLGYLAKAISAMQRLKWIKLNPFVFKIMIFNDNYGNVFLYACLLVLCVLGYLIIQDSKEVRGTFANPAMKRKEKAKLLRRTRWSKNAIVQSLVVVLLLTVGYHYDNKEVALTPPQEYTINGKIITIPLSDVEDGHLHRFEYKTPNGFDVRFIVVKKPQGVAYGVGLDACEICGIAGYFERGDDIVCKRCDVVMNKNTIGFKGGCNPIPFPYEIKDSTIIINADDLIAEELRFR